MGAHLSVEGYKHAFRVNLTALRNDKLLLTTIIAAIGSVTTLTLSDYLSQKSQPPLHPNTNHTQEKHTKQTTSNSMFRKRLLMLLRICFPKLNCHANRLLLVQFFLLVLRALISVKVSKMNVMLLTKAISKASWKIWMQWMVNFICWMALAVGTNSFLKYTESRIALLIRSQLTMEAHRLYLSNRNLYKHAVSLHSFIHSRIADEIPEFSTKIAHFYGHSFKPLLEFILGLAEATKDLGYIRPFGLFFVTGFLGGIIRKFSPNISKLTIIEQEIQADFRNAHARLASNAEKISLLQGEECERQILDEMFEGVVDFHIWRSLLLLGKTAMDRILRFQALLVGGIFVHLPFLHMTEADSSDRIARFRAAESMLLGCGTSFAEIMMLHKKVAEISGHSNHLGEMFEMLQIASSDEDKAYRGTSQDYIEFKDLTFRIPKEERVLISNLNLRIDEGEHLIISGPNGAGKTSIFRVLAGIWPADCGEIYCTNDQVMWVPQQPYLVLGNLRDQITYPERISDSKDDETIRECLTMAGLHKVLEESESLDRTQTEWNDVFSGGERQRIGFARLYYHRPRFAILDEVTSAINPDDEFTLYELVIRQGTTVISIAHRLELRRLHSKELQLIGDGKYHIVNLE